MNVICSLFSKFKEVSSRKCEILAEIGSNRLYQSRKEQGVLYLGLQVGFEVTHNSVFILLRIEMVFKVALLPCEYLKTT